MRKIALIGRAPQTRHYIPLIPDDVEIWIIAAVHNLEELPRQPDVCIEIHPEWMISNPRYYQHHDLEMWQWLQEPHNFPIYLNTLIPQVPAGVQYPFDDVLGLLPNVRRGDNINRFFTSSFDWLIALAILQDVSVIYFYGWDMGSETEYKYQRDGGHYWLGVAAGRGIRIELPEECNLARTYKLYGLENAQMITKDRIAELFNAQDKIVENMRREYTEFKDGTFERYLRHFGARSLYQEILENKLLDDIIYRQRLEEYRRGIQQKWWGYQSVHNTHLGIARTLQGIDDGMTVEELKRRLNDKFDIIAQEYYAHEGAFQAAEHMIQEIDGLAPPVLEMRELTIPIKSDGEDLEVK